MVWKLLIAVALGFVLLGVSHITNPSERVPSLDWHAAMWLWPYLAGIGVLSYLSTFDGNGTLPFGPDIIVVTVFSLAIYFFAMQVRLEPEKVRQYIGDLSVEAEEEQKLGGIAGEGAH